jgi:hypothetical protein
MRETRRRGGGGSGRARARDTADRVGHRMVGHMNPHCAVCGRTAMQIAKSPLMACRRATLPFDEIDPAPLKVSLPTKAKAV